MANHWSWKLFLPLVDIPFSASSIINTTTMLSSILSRRAASAVATINKAAMATTNTPAAAASTAVSSSSSSIGYAVRQSSTAPQSDEALEYTPVLKLNMLQDNPGAVQKVSRYAYTKIFFLVTKNHDTLLTQCLGNLFYC